MKKALLIGALAVAALTLSPLAWGRFLDGPWGMIPGGAFRGRDEPSTGSENRFQEQTRDPISGFGEPRAELLDIVEPGE